MKEEKRRGGDPPESRPGRMRMRLQHITIIREHKRMNEGRAILIRRPH